MTAVHCKSVSANLFCDKETQRTWICCSTPVLLPPKPLGNCSRPHASIAVVNAVGCVILMLPARRRPASDPCSSANTARMLGRAQHGSVPLQLQYVQRELPPAVEAYPSTPKQEAGKR